MRDKSEILQDELLKAYRPDEFPAVLAQTGEWRRSRILEGVRIFDAAPVFRNTLGKYMALLAGGAELTVGYSSKVPYDPAIVQFLKSTGIPVAENDFAGETDIVLDCAGVHRNKKARFGYVELTRSGVAQYHDSDKPVFLVDSGRIKKIETMLGTGESCLRALKHLGYSDVSGRKILLFGFGKVGRGIAVYLSGAGAEVTVVDDRNLFGNDCVYPLIDMRSDADIRNEIAQSWAVITATSRAGALNGFAPSLNRSGTMLINMGIEDEFGRDIPETRVLNCKKPLNFILDEPTQMKYIDPTMALHNEGARVLLTETRKPGIFEPDAATEDKILDSVLKAGLINREIEKAGL